MLMDYGCDACATVELCSFVRRGRGLVVVKYIFGRNNGRADGVIIIIDREPSTLSITLVTFDIPVLLCFVGVFNLVFQFFVTSFAFFPPVFAKGNAVFLHFYAIISDETAFFVVYL